ncbi:hypothetical protein diail_4671 [Diaporthe ilicicola]|nr:hypothetical protein diail_4671 [Diaporthe ilicicola]
MFRGNMQEENVELHRKYGKVVRLGPNYYSFDDPAAVKTIYGHGTQHQKSEWYEVWSARRSVSRTNMFALRDIKQHSSTRRHHANVYAMSSLVSYEPYYYAFDVIGETTYSKRFGFLETGMDISDMIKTIAKKDSINGYDDPERQAITQPDFCSKLLDLSEAAQLVEKNLDGLTQSEIVVGGCTGNIFAGSDTTSISLNATFYNIIKNPRVQSKRAGRRPR